MHRVLVVGQTPPPYHGQSIMIERMLDLKYTKIKLFHVRMSFSHEMDDIGRFRITKVWSLILTIFKILIARFRYKTKILYYPPSGPNKIPIYRDMVILILTRWLFKKTVFHFHAGGISEIYQRLSKFEKLLFRIAYYNADAAILLSELNPRDDIHLRSKHTYIIPYGLEDQFSQTKKVYNDVPMIIFVGLIKETKGVLILIEALKILRDNGIKFKAKFIGGFESKEIELLIFKIIKNYNLQNLVDFKGILSGDEKWQEFYNADIFAFPTFYESETFGLVILEAMQFQLPTVVSDWRGVPSLVTEGVTGYIVPSKDAISLSEKLEILCKDKNLRKELGENARKTYLKNYSIEKFCSNIEEALIN